MFKRVLAVQKGGLLHNPWLNCPAALLKDNFENIVTVQYLHSYEITMTMTGILKESSRIFF